MKSKNMLYKATEFKNLKELFKNKIVKYSDNIAFIIKNRAGSNQKYTNITYKEFGLDIKTKKQIHNTALI